MNSFTLLRLTPGREFSFPVLVDCIGLRSCVDAVMKRKIRVPAVNRTQVVQHIASHCTNRLIIIDCIDEQ
jgi:hypothetical protein